MDNQSLNNLFQQARQYLDRGDYQQGIARSEELATQARASDNPNYELWALSYITVCWANLGNYSKMAEIATRLLAHARQFHNKEFEMEAILRLAIALARMDVRGRWQEIQPLLLEGLEVARQLEKPFWEIYHLMRLGEFAVLVGEEAYALEWLQEALNAITPDLRQHYFRGEGYAAFSMLMRRQGQFAEAVRYAELAVGEMQADSNPSFIGKAQLCLAEAEQARGERGEALRLVMEVLEQAQQHGWQSDEQEAYYLRGKLERELGHAEQAEEAARQSLGLAQQMKLKEGEVKCLLSLGQALQALQRREEANTILRQARRLSQEREYADHFAKAEELLQALSNGR